MKKVCCILCFTLAPLTHLNAMVLKTRHVISWTDHDVLKDHGLFINELTTTKNKNSCDVNGNPFLHALWYAELKDIQLHGSTAHSHGFLKRAMLRKLYIESFDFDITNKDRRTLLMLMAQTKDRYYNVHCGARDSSCSCSSAVLENISELINFYKANPNIQDKEGLTALMHAIKNDNTVAALELIKSGIIKLDVQDAEGQTALIHAIIKGNDPIADLLLKQGANINLYDKYGGSALLYTVRNNRNPTMAQKLLVLGANLKLSHKSHVSLYVVKENDKLRDLIGMFDKYYACYEDEAKLRTFLKDNPYVECFFELAALNDHQITLDCVTQTPEHMLAILERCAKWNKKGAIEYAFNKLITLEEISPQFYEDKVSFDERSLCCSLCCCPLLQWLMSHKTASEKFLLKKLSTTYKIRDPKAERPFEMVFESTIYKKAFKDFFKNYNSYSNEWTKLVNKK